MITVLGMRTKAPEGAFNVDTTSRSRNWSRGLSPFFLGPVKLWGPHEARCVENAWQYSKVYPQHVGPDGEPNGAWWDWSRGGWDLDRPMRHPMGRGKKPLYAHWDGRHLDYVPARKTIYLPLYRDAVRPTEAFAELVRVSQRNDHVVLRDFDGYDHRALGMTLEEVLDCRSRIMGHGFVLAMMLKDMGIE
jgi:hypothetical protein